MARSRSNCYTVCTNLLPLMLPSNISSWASLSPGSQDSSSNYRNVPGVALYFYTLTSIRTELSYLPFFRSTYIPTAAQNTTNTNRSALVKLSVPGNLMAGAIARTSVGFILNPITVLKARYEVNRLFSGYDGAISL
jgi:hypothetical protein